VPTFGFAALTIAFVLSVYSALVLIWAVHRKDHTLHKSARRAVINLFVLLTAASLVLLHALITRDFQVEYVAQYSNRSLSLFYTLAAFWAGQDGSLLLWAWLLSAFGAVVVLVYRHRDWKQTAYSLAIIEITLSFFLYLLVFKSNPFSQTAFTPADGAGLNPLLQNPEMLFHPPTLYIGFVGFTVPFAMAMASLVTRKLDREWSTSIRRWALFSWLFLTIGNILGMQWAYVELGWGGYWAWDPVENASLLPWLTATAFLHSFIVHKRRGGFKLWSMSLLLLTFVLTIFGTFVTRSGLIESVHAFGVSDLGPVFLIFLALVLFSSIGLLVGRRSFLKSDLIIESWSSKEASFMINNVLFGALTLGTLLGTLMPSISEALTGQKLSVTESFFNRMATPLGLALFLLAGICIALTWNTTRFKDQYRKLLPPLILSVVIFITTLTGSGFRFLPTLALTIFGFSVSMLFISSWNELRLGQSSQQDRGPVSVLKTIKARRQRYGGYIVHLGMFLIFLGFTGSAFISEKTAQLDPGQRIVVDDVALEYMGIDRVDRPDRITDTAQFSIIENNSPVASIQSQKLYVPRFQPSTEVGIHSTLARDIYVILGSYNIESQSATIHMMINPLVAWIWVGGIVMIIGGVLALSARVRTTTHSREH
jgi:cytochrome c-type biogenesis protein CcmF